MVLPKGHYISVKWNIPDVWDVVEETDAEIRIRADVDALEDAAEVDDAE